MSIIKFDFKKFLEEKLGDNFVFANEFAKQKNQQKFYGVIKKLGGELYSNSAMYRFQIDFFVESQKAEELINELNGFINTTNNIRFSEAGEFITPIYITPSFLETNLQIGNTIGCRVAMWANIGIQFNMTDISVVKIDDAKCEFLKASLSWVATSDFSRKSGQEQSKAINITSSTQFTVDLINNSGLIANKIRQIRMGEISKNTTFNISVEFTDNGAIEIYSMILTSSMINSSRGSLPSASLTFIGREVI